MFGECYFEGVFEFFRLAIEVPARVAVVVRQWWAQESTIINRPQIDDYLCTQIRLSSNY
jgi:hypothetical protein